MEWCRHKREGRFIYWTFTRKMLLAASTPLFPANIWSTDLQPANVAVIGNFWSNGSRQVQSWVCGAQHDLGTLHQSLERGER
jgi:hypothetical protein